MTTQEAIQEAQRWLAHTEEQKEKAKRLQELARLAKTHHAEARRLLQQLDSQPIVYDGARLAEAVRTLIAALSRCPVTEGEDWPGHISPAVETREVV